MSYTAELTRHYSDIRKRLVGKPQPVKRVPIDYSHPARLLRFVLPRREGWHGIVDQVCVKHGVSTGDILGRLRHLQEARDEAWWRVRHEYVMPMSGQRPSLTHMARMFRRRDHSSISLGLKRHRERNGL